MKIRKTATIIFLIFVMLLMGTHLFASLTNSLKVEDIQIDGLGALDIQIGNDITKIAHLQNYIEETKEYFEDGSGYRVIKSVSIATLNKESQFDNMEIQTYYDSNIIGNITFYEFGASPMEIGEFKYSIFNNFGKNCGGKFGTLGSTSWPDSYWMYWNGYIGAVKVSVEYYQSADYNLSSSYGAPMLKLMFGKHSFNF